VKSLDVIDAMLQQVWLFLELLRLLQLASLVIEIRYYGTKRSLTKFWEFRKKVKDSHGSGVIRVSAGLSKHSGARLVFDC